MNITRSNGVADRQICERCSPLYIGTAVYLRQITRLEMLVVAMAIGATDILLARVATKVFLFVKKNKNKNRHGLASFSEGKKYCLLP